MKIMHYKSLDFHAMNRIYNVALSRQLLLSKKITIAYNYFGNTNFNQEFPCARKAFC